MIHPNVYIVDLEKFGKQVVMRLLRRTKSLALLIPFIAPFKWLYNAFFAYKEQQLYIRAHSAKKCLFEKALNDGFDDEDRRIYIETTSIGNTSHVYDPEFSDPVYAFDAETEYLLDNDKYFTSSTNFTVFVPEALEEADETEKLLFETKLNGEIERYKIFGTTHKIEYYA